MELTRRAVLGGAVTISAALLSGCSRSDDESSQEPQRRLGAVGVINEIEENVVTSVSILRDGEVVYWNEFEIEASTDTKRGNPVTHSISVVPPDYSAEPGHYLIGVRNQTMDQNAVLDLDEAYSYDDNCYFIIAILQEGGIAFGNGSSDEYTNCPDQSNEHSTTKTDPRLE